MAKGRPAAGGGRHIDVSPERIAGWLSGFAERHGPLHATRRGPGEIRFQAADGAYADCAVPFPPFPWPAAEPASGARRDGAAPQRECGGRAETATGEPGKVAAALARHAAAERRVGVLLVRLGGYAAGVFDGTTLVASKVGSRLVHGRSAAGGTSQRRFARRRDHQARQALQAAADNAVRVLAPYAADRDPAVGPDRPSPEPALAGLVCGGDRTAVEALRRDRRLAALFAYETGPFLTVPDPRLAVLKDTPRRFRAVTIRVVEPAGSAPD
jgi:hypothetical protein